MDGIRCYVGYARVAVFITYRFDYVNSAYKQLFKLHYILRYVL